MSKSPEQRYEAAKQALDVLLHPNVVGGDDGVYRLAWVSAQLLVAATDRLAVVAGHLDRIERALAVESRG